MRGEAVGELSIEVGQRLGIEGNEKKQKWEGTAGKGRNIIEESGLWEAKGRTEGGVVHCARLC